MDKITVAFCGQKGLYFTKSKFKKLTLNLEVELVKFLEENFGKNITFYFAGSGGFDSRAFAALYELKDIYAFETVFVSAIPLGRRAKVHGYDGAVFPFAQPLTGGSATRRRNEWLVDNCDVLFSFSPLKSVYDNYMLDYAKTHRQITGKPKILLISSD
ncbi:MAG: hypothetical protein K2G96_00970 [Clostridia bacterium]|nr:hypothetical protein [Clostridia bacterium]